MTARSKSYVPRRGDCIWLQFAPQSGHEQSGRRPALVISPRNYNEKVGLGLFCPITSKVKDYPFEVALKIPARFKLNGVVLSDQVKSLDWKARQARFICKAPQQVVDEVTAKLQVLIN